MEYSTLLRELSDIRHMLTMAGVKADKISWKISMIGNNRSPCDLCRDNGGRWKLQFFPMKTMRPVIVCNVHAHMVRAHCDPVIDIRKFALRLSVCLTNFPMVEPSREMMCRCAACNGSVVAPSTFDYDDDIASLCPSCVSCAQDRVELSWKILCREMSRKVAFCWLSGFGNQDVWKLICAAWWNIVDVRWEAIKRLK